MFLSGLDSGIGGGENGSSTLQYMEKQNHNVAPNQPLAFRPPNEHVCKTPKHLLWRLTALLWICNTQNIEFTIIMVFLVLGVAKQVT